MPIARAALRRHRRVRHRRRMARSASRRRRGSRRAPSAGRVAAPRRAASSDADVEREHAAEAAHLPLRQLVLRMRRQPGIDRRCFTFGCAARNSASAMAVGVVLRHAQRAASWCRAAPATNRTGSRIAPSAFWMNFSHSMSSSRTAMTMPPTLSLWPFRYFVVLWTTRSAPNSIGRCMYGLANVLSTTSRDVVAVRELGGARAGR